MMTTQYEDVLDKLKWFNNPDNHKGTDTVAWIPRKILSEAIQEIRNLRESLEDRNMEIGELGMGSLSGIRGSVMDELRESV